MKIPNIFRFYKFNNFLNFLKKNDVIGIIEYLEHNGNIFSLYEMQKIYIICCQFSSLQIITILLNRRVIDRKELLLYAAQNSRIDIINTFFIKFILDTKNELNKINTFIGKLIDDAIFL